MAEAYPMSLYLSLIHIYFLQKPPDIVKRIFGQGLCFSCPACKTFRRGLIFFLVKGKPGLTAEKCV